MIREKTIYILQSVQATARDFQGSRDSPVQFESKPSEISKVDVRHQNEFRFTNSTTDAIWFLALAQRLLRDPSENVHSAE